MAKMKTITKTEFTGDKGCCCILLLLFWPAAIIYYILNTKKISETIDEKK